jgi:hypothetical protein
MEESAKLLALWLYFALVIAVSALLTAWPVELLWNWLIPDLFALKHIDFWHAFGLSALCSLLFKSLKTPTGWWSQR